MSRKVCNSRIRASAALALVVLLIAVAACGSDESGPSVTGQVIAVESRSITEFETLTVLDDDGKEWRFKGGLFSGFTPSHLQEHMALGDPVRVWYVQEGDELRVTRIADG